jgi:hypothetical protein
MISIEKQGKAGEQALNDWFKETSLSYVAICQAKETFSPLFTGDVKRPDFLLLFEGLGMIAVDAKNHTLSGGVFTLNYEDLVRSIAFERLFRLSIWYAYLADQKSPKEWFWISALKAIEVGEKRENSQNKEIFLAIKKEHFECVSVPEDLAKLYTHRIPKATSISTLSR